MIIKKFMLYLCSCIVLIQLVCASPSDLDTSFNGTGATTNLFAAFTTNQAQDIAIQTDDKIVAVGTSGDNAIIVRYANDGSLDTTFNQNSNTPGLLTIILGTHSAIHGVAIQPIDQKIVVAGYTIINNVSNAFIARFNNDGSPDITFGTSNSGYIITIFQAASELYGITLQDDGAIIVTGYATVSGFSLALVARYTSSGILDTTFNNTGYVTTLIGSLFTKAFNGKVQLDGKIVITGNAIIENQQQLVVIRYNSDGSLDQTFNSSGNITIAGSTAPLHNFLTSSSNSLIIQPHDQKIIITGATNRNEGGFNNQLFTIVRLNTDGTLDTTFNNSGYIISNIGIEATDVVLQSNGQIVVSGFNYSYRYIIIITRFNSNGTMDPTFNYNVNNSTLNCVGTAIALQKNGKIIICGTITIPYLTI